MTEITPIFEMDRSVRPLGIANMRFITQEFPFASRTNRRTRMSRREISKMVESITESQVSSFFIRSRNAEEILFEGDGFNFVLDMSEFGDAVSISALAVAKDGATAKALISSFEDSVPIFRPDDTGTVMVDFWHRSVNGSNSFTRTITVPTWKDIVQNYNEQTRADVESILLRDRSSFTGAGGKLLIWRGDPGLGKTFAIRSLLSEWKSWCRGHYITDPEQFLNDSQYLMNVLLEEDEDEEAEYDYDHLGNGGVSTVGTTGKKWKLVILEDAGELISVEAKARTGQALQRLLNVTEGMIGQGLQVMILITTNEDIEKFEPAVIRNGRCLQNIEFQPLSKEEATAWCERQEIEHPDFRYPTPLSDLFALKDGLITPDQLLKNAKRPVGFGR